MTAVTCNNGDGPSSATNASRGLTHLLGLGERGLAVKATQICTVDDCEKPVRARGWCSTHHMRWSKHGDPTLGAWKPANTKCAAPDCEKPPQGRYCGMHRFRLERTGSLDLAVRDHHSHSQGYVVVKRPGHPAGSDPRGWIYEHRAVLYDTIGPGAHGCHHCGASVSWDRSYPEHLDALVVDHLDEDRTNNDPTNLVPSCSPCNIARSSRWIKRRRREAGA